MQTEKFKWKYCLKSNRVQGYDYSSNWAYFITICTKDRQEFFGEIIDWEMVLNGFGNAVKWFWLEILNHFPSVVLDEFVIMPNHVHGILLIQNIVETRQCLVSTNNLDIKLNRFQNQWKWTISSIIGSFKSICTKTINKSQNKIYFSWQSNYYDRIIRNEDELTRIRKYILENPIKWELDKNNTENLFM